MYTHKKKKKRNVCTCAHAQSKYSLKEVKPLGLTMLPTKTID